MTGNKRAEAAGFSLMELLVVLGIFSTVVVSASDIFLSANKAQRKIAALERAQSDARFTLEAVTREVRGGRIDWQYYVDNSISLTGPVEILALRDGTDAPIVFHRSDAGNASYCPDAASTPCLLVTLGTPGVDQPAPLTPKGVTAQNVKFYVAPAADPSSFNPAAGTYASNGQPRVTTVLVLKSTEQRAIEGAVVYAQTTSSSRWYPR
ncbi:prepilin-type N-terminal cleavage/methylation domain-containing protein [Candidatus Uhrbacteria bacterium]|nr:prepilin-type N-terminal cleavage/methylation domain-containing protein [Candidatus Uhrbacteria bacterium]